MNWTLDKYAITLYISYIRLSRYVDFILNPVDLGTVRWACGLQIYVYYQVENEIEVFAKLWH